MVSSMRAHSKGDASVVRILSAVYERMPSSKNCSVDGERFRLAAG
jgi:hypothetical protein